MIRHSLFFIIGLCPLATVSHAQVQVYDPKRAAERNVEYRVNNKVDQGINRGLDKVEEGIGNIFKKKNKKAQDTKPADDAYTDQQPADGNAGSVSGSSSAGSADNAARPSGAKTNEPVPLKAYSKFDFVPGDKIVAAEDFEQDAVGDFPAKWNTNGSAEVVTIGGKPGKWLMVRKTESTSFIPDFVKDLPDNFTLEYDLVYSGFDKDYAYAQRLYTTVHETKKNDDRITHQAAGRGATFLINGGMGSGNAELLQTNEEGGYTDLRGERDMALAINPDNNGKVFHMALWRQKQRLRVYVDEVKVFDLPRIFPADVKLNAMRFHSDMSEDRNQFFISNIRLAVGAPDTRSKLMTEGKFSTTGILFDVNSDKIRPESYGVLKDIAGTLTENAGVRVRIVGHTDSDGDDAKNLDLSKRRAASVRAALASEFGIDAGRLETDGKGETQPAAPNTSPEGKANNRRVEFIKL
ncbi:OmpA family protein [Spirosoma spitsbergense]|uniref:OmpA family protein n=1 Tax=Spirosoma spitsbergense TaxID=431554 RepID=UPI00039BC23B|nr:OmpA family protein [Spirosoma spitsbergense]